MRSLIGDQIQFRGLNVVFSVEDVYRADLKKTKNFSKKNSAELYGLLTPPPFKGFDYNPLPVFFFCARGPKGWSSILSKRNFFFVMLFSANENVCSVWHAVTSPPHHVHLLWLCLFICFDNIYPACLFS